MSDSTPAVALPDPVMAAFDNAPTFEPLEPAEEAAIRAALATACEGLTTAQLLESVRPKA